MSEHEQVKNPEIREQYSGSYGIVLQPDRDTAEHSIQLAEQLTPEAEYRVRWPHITLYHGHVTELPHDEVQKILLAAKQILLEKPQELRDIQVFGGKFVFWDIVKNQEMREAHDAALGLAKFLDRTKLAPATKEGLNLTEEQIDNVKQYGHPLVRGLYRPHITLSYDSNGIVLPPDLQSFEWKMNVDNVHFAEMGNLGSVAKIIV